MTYLPGPKIILYELIDCLAEKTDLAFQYYGRQTPNHSIMKFFNCFFLVLEIIIGFSVKLHQKLFGHNGQAEFQDLQVIYFNFQKRNCTGSTPFSLYSGCRRFPAPGLTGDQALLNCQDLLFCFLL